MRGDVKNTKKHILKAMFDLRHLNKAGGLDVGKINQVAAVLDLREKVIEEEKLEKKENKKEKFFKKKKAVFIKQEPPFYFENLPTKEEILSELSKIDEEEQLLFKSISENKPVISKKPQLWQEELSAEELFSDSAVFTKPIPSKDIKKENVFDDLLSQPVQTTLPASINLEPVKRVDPRELDLSHNKTFLNKGWAGFLAVCLLIALVVPLLGWLEENLSRKEKITASSLTAYQNLLSAKQSLKETNWQEVEKNFSLAHDNFFEANEEIKKLGKLTLNLLEQLPGGSLISSGAHLVEVGENLALAGQNLTIAISLFTSEDLFGLFNEENDKSLTDLIASSKEKLNEAFLAVSTAQQELNQVEIESLPLGFQEEVLSLKEQLPSAEELLSQSLNYSTALLDILGHDNSRQYLLLFQNNSEIRATGGFIGTYGLLSLDRGRIKKLFVDGIFNVDGQLREKIIPPRPIQKISTAWSMHDSNWFADFPTSAQKTAWFYEKTGGPTVDGVIALTPVVVERLLKLTGPIVMPEYEIILTPKNFVELIQYKVEVDYDKDLNQPKKILADFAPKFIKALTELSLENKKEAFSIIFEALDEKHILIYFNQNDLENFIGEQGWGGRIIETEKDYLSVVSSNINGFKTDKVVKEEISHQAEIQPDGSVIDTLTILRQHQGGNLAYDWWNQVNANYLRVYLPLGSELISAEGQTVEVYLPPFDYEKHGFDKDPLVKQIEDGMIIDRKTGTHIFEESNKTVFGNWVYVSPGETVELTYRYKLPFKIDINRSTDSYSLLVQKQAGSLGSQFIHSLNFPEIWQTSWQYPENWELNSGFGKWEGDLKTDKFFGTTFEF